MPAGRRRCCRAGVPTPAGRRRSLGRTSASCPCCRAGTPLPATHCRPAEGQVGQESLGRLQAGRDVARSAKPTAMAAEGLASGRRRRPSHLPPATAPPPVRQACPWRSHRGSLLLPCHWLWGGASPSVILSIAKDPAVGRPVGQGLRSPLGPKGLGTSTPRRRRARLLPLLPPELHQRLPRHRQHHRNPLVPQPRLE